MIDIVQIWRDAAHGGPPVLVKREKGDLLLRMPFQKGNRAWIEKAGKADWLLRWDKEGQHWLTPRSWFESLATRLIERYGCAWIIQEADESPTPCNESCMRALGPDCVCGCGGKNHGLGEPAGWAHGVVDSDIVAWRGKHYTCRFFKPRDAGMFTKLVAAA